MTDKKFGRQRRAMQQAAAELMLSFERVRGEMLAASEATLSKMDRAALEILSVMESLREMRFALPPSPDLSNFNPDKRRRPGKRRRDDDGLEPSLVVPKPKPTPLQGGAEAPIE